ncbi:Bromodomain and PHD finger-containing protein 3 [Bienertia sinuspersici]
MSRRRGEKRSWGGERGSLGDVQRRRSPRLAGSTFAPDRLLQINGDCNKQSNNQNPSTNDGGDANTSARRTASKHQKLLFCDSDDNEDDDEELVADPQSCLKPLYSNKHETKPSTALPCPLHSCEQDDGAANHHGSLNDGNAGYKVALDTNIKAILFCRRDTYDIFAEPVDPSEVEEYYEIIKEPMDFGTMRAKLHEGMYKNLQQFERDVFLIFGNAMHFNSSATVYFRQARALEELAKKVFHFLKTDPEAFKLDFTATRRRSSRRFNGELSGLNIGSGRKLARDSGSNSMSTDLSRKDKEDLLQLVLIDVHHTDLGCASLMKQGNPEDIRYKESLMLFVKDLGPTAHRVAKRKLQGTSIQASSSSLDMNSLDFSTHHKSETHAASLPFQRETNQSLSGRGTLPATNPSSHHLFNIKTANDIRQPRNDSCHATTTPPPHPTTMPPPVKQIQIVQAIPCSNSSRSRISVSRCQDAELRTTPSRSVGVSEFSHRSSPSPAGHSTSAVSKDMSNMILLPPPSMSVSTQFTGRIPYLMSRLGDSSGDAEYSHYRNGQPAALQMQRDTAPLNGYSNQNNRLYCDNHHITLPYVKNTQQPNLTLEL